MKDMLITDFDKEHRILHLSATETVDVRTEDDLGELCEAVQEAIQALGPERCYMIVDLSKIAIDPELAPAYGDKVEGMCEACLYPHGLARYGYRITRVTIRLSGRAIDASDETLFKTEDEARQYIHKQIRRREDAYSEMAQG